MEKRNYGWWVIGVLSILCIGMVIGAVLMAVFAPDGPYELLLLLADRWLEVITAVGTVLAAVGAFFTASVALKVSRDAQRIQKRERVEAAATYIITKKTAFVYVTFLLNDMLDGISHSVCHSHPFVSRKLIDRLKELNKQLNDFDYYQAGLVSTPFRDLSRKIIDNLLYIERNDLNSDSQSLDSRDMLKNRLTTILGQANELVKIALKIEKRRLLSEMEHDFKAVR